MYLNVKISRQQWWKTWRQWLRFRHCCDVNIVMIISASHNGQTISVALLSCTTLAVIVDRGADWKISQCWINAFLSQVRFQLLDFFLESGIAFLWILKNFALKYEQSWPASDNIDKIANHVYLLNLVNLVKDWKNKQNKKKTP